MSTNTQLKDPYNIIIAGVGGQGNVTASRILGRMLVNQYMITIGETFGASQRGGPVTSHIRVSRTSTWSPQIPAKGADLVIAFEPAEAERVLQEYGNKNTFCVINTRPVYPVGAVDDYQYPTLQTIKDAVAVITGHTWFLDATDKAIKILHKPILQNIIMLGAVAGLDVLPIDITRFSQVIPHFFPDQVDINVKAFEIGRDMIHGLDGTP